MGAPEGATGGPPTTVPPTTVTATTTFYSTMSTPPISPTAPWSTVSPTTASPTTASPTSASPTSASPTTVPPSPPASTESTTSSGDGQDVGCQVGAEVVYDNLDAAWTFDAGWEERTNDNAVSGSFHSSQSVPNIAAANALASGYWEVSVTWWPSSTRSPAAIHHIKHLDAAGAPATTTVLVDQRQMPPVAFLSLGTFAFVAGDVSLGLQVESDADGWKTIVDAVKFTCRGDVPPEFSTAAPTAAPTEASTAAPTQPSTAAPTQASTAAPTAPSGACQLGSQVIVDNLDSAWLLDAGWEVRSNSQAYETTFLSSQSKPDLKAVLPSSALPTGQWKVSVFWTASSTRTQEAVHVVKSLDGAGAVVATAVSVNQRDEPPAEFLALGTFTFVQGVAGLGLEVTSDLNGYKTIIDAVKFECKGHVDPNATVPTDSVTEAPADPVTTAPAGPVTTAPAAADTTVPPASGSCVAGHVYIIDNLDDAFQFDAGWELRLGKGAAISDSFHMTSSAGLRAFASSASLPSGRYAISVHWVASPSRTETAIHQVEYVDQLGAHATTVLYVDQRVDPPVDFVSLGAYNLV